MRPVLLLAAQLGAALGQDLTCPTGSSARPTTFHVIGASGGDSKAACENTAAATTAGLAAGATAVELDVSMSKDKVVFLWNDPNPLEPTAQARSRGLFVHGLCRPVFHSLTSARGQVFEHIRENFRYSNSSDMDQGVTIPTLHEWMNQFATDSRLQLIMLDLKVGEVDQADYLVEHIFTRAILLGVAGKLRLLSPSYDMTAALQSSLARANLDKDLASRALGGTVGTIHLGQPTDDFNPLTIAVEECYGMTSVGQSVSSNGWREYQEIVKRMVVTRDEEADKGNKYIPVVVWRINTLEQLAWLMCQGVDGILTDEPRQLSIMAQRRQLGDIVCCHRTLTMDCLSGADGRVAGQACATLGLSWATTKAQDCPLLPFPFAFLAPAGTQFSCTQSRFAPPGHSADCS